MLRGIGVLRLAEDRERRGRSTSAPMGRFTKKASRQLAASMMSAPSVGPAAAASAPTAPQMPTAVARFSRGNSPSTSAREDGRSAAAPTAWMTRAAISRPAVGAAPANAEETVKMTTPAKKTLRRPMRSAKRPAGTSRAAKTIV